jgi:hypothetical protein
MSTVYARLLNNIKTSAEWAESDFALYEGEIGIESDTKLMKVGDGSSTWNNLPYMALSDIAGIKNVSINSPVDGQVITYNSGGWANYDIPTLPTNIDLMYYDNTNSDFAAKSDIPTDVSDLTNDAGYLVQDDLAGYAIISECGKKALLEWTNSSTTLTCRVYDKNNNVLSTSSVIIPITSIIDSGYFDTATNEIVLVLSDQSEIRIPASGLVDGLQPKITVSDPLDASLVSGLSTVATSGNYDDLTNKPTIPSAAKDGVLTIQKDGTTLGTFSANQASNKTINITMPSLAGYATEQWVLDKSYATENWVSTRGYATENWVSTRGYATETWANSTFAQASHTHDYAPSTHNHARTYVINESNPGNELRLQWASNNMWYKVDSTVNRKMVYEGFHNYAEVQNRNGTQLGIGVQWEGDAYLEVYINGTRRGTLLSDTNTDTYAVRNDSQPTYQLGLSWDNVNQWPNLRVGSTWVNLPTQNWVRAGFCSVTPNHDFCPFGSSGTWLLGNSSHRWKNAYLAAGPNVSSDSRVKDNIVDLDDGLVTINKLQVKSYTLNGLTDQISYGVIAQDVAKELPELVSVPKNEDDIYGIHLGNVVFAMVKAIQELSEKVVEMERKIAVMSTGKF